MITLSIIKADTGRYVGHPGMHPRTINRRSPEPVTVSSSGPFAATFVARATGIRPWTRRPCRPRPAERPTGTDTRRPGLGILGPVVATAAARQSRQIDI